LKEAKQRRTIEAIEAEKLISELEAATLVEPQEIPADVVTMNSVVKISFEGEGRQQEFKIVYPDEADFRAKKV
jgi:regulator of nucleoside diphosphate kinase